MTSLSYQEGLLVARLQNSTFITVSVAGIGSDIKATKMLLKPEIQQPNRSFNSYLLHPRLGKLARIIVYSSRQLTWMTSL